MSADIIAATMVMCFFPMGLKCISQEGMILGSKWIPFGQFMDKWVEKLPDELRKPVWACERCMVPYWGLAAALTILYTPWYIYGLPLIVTAIGIQHTLDK